MGSCMDKKDADSTPLKLGDNEKMDGKLKLAKKKSVFDEDDSDGDMFNNWAIDDETRKRRPLWSIKKNI